MENISLKQTNNLMKLLMKKSHILLTNIFVLIILYIDDKFIYSIQDKFEQFKAYENVFNVLFD